MSFKPKRHDMSICVGFIKCDLCVSKIDILVYIVVDKSEHYKICFKSFQWVEIAYLTEVLPVKIHKGILCFFK